MKTPLQTPAVQESRGEPNDWATFVREAGDLLSFGGWVLDVASDRLTLSEAGAKLLGLSAPHGVLSRSDLVSRVDPLDRSSLRDGLTQLIAHGADLDVTCRVSHEPSDVRWLRVVARSEGRLGELATRVVGAIQDVTAARSADDAVIESEERFRSLVEATSTLVWRITADGRRLGDMDGWQRFTGATYEGGHTPDDPRWDGADPVHPEDRERTTQTFLDAMRDGRPYEIVHRVRRVDGVYRTMEGCAIPIRNADGTIREWVGAHTDITERVETERALRQSQKMEMLGLFAGTVAHDFNNLLSAIIGGTELARMEIADGAPSALELDEVRKSAMRGAQLTRQLLAFSRVRAAHTRLIDMRDLVADVEGLLRRLLPSGILLDIAACAEPSVVRVDAGQWEQVLMNLVVNARDAIEAQLAQGPATSHALLSGAPSPSLIAVSIEHRTSRPPDTAFVGGGDTLGPGRGYVVLSVRDTGTGMDAETSARIFEPFFTTKGEGRGTGLGLATAINIVRQAGGGISLKTAPGAGSTFSVWLPLVDAPAETTRIGGAPLPRGTERVLLVEDETVVRETARRILERYGYVVEVARHGADAVSAWHESTQGFDLLISDLRMPDLRVADFLSHFRSTVPDLAVLIMSGYASGRDSAENELIDREVFLAKPFTTESLLVQARAALGRVQRGNGIHTQRAPR